MKSSRGTASSHVDVNKFSSNTERFCAAPSGLTPFHEFSESQFSESVVRKAEENFCTAELLLAVTQLCIGTLGKYQKILLGPSS